MTKDFKILNSLLGYGEPKSDIWFIGKEEHSDLNSKYDWDNEIIKILDYSIDKIGEFEVRIGKFSDNNEGIWPGYCLISALLAKYLNVKDDQAFQILGKEKNFYTNIFPIPNIVEGKKEPEWFSERTGISYNDYFSYILNKRIDLFCQAIRKYKPKDIIVFIGTGYAEKFLDQLFKKFINGGMEDGPSRLAYLPRIYWTYHPSGLNSAKPKVKKEDWIKDIISHF